MAQWATIGLVSNSSVLVVQDLIDAHYMPTATLSTVTVMAVANFGCLSAAFASSEIVRRIVERVFPAQQVAAGAEFDTGASRSIRNRALAFLVGAALGFFPLMWPEDWRLWEAGNIYMKPPEELLHCQEHFPDAIKGPKLEEIVHKALAERGWSVDNTLVAYASCPEEVNTDDRNDLLNVMKRRWRRQFSLGGLAGMAFGGETAWGAFAAHVPKDGNILIVYGPHTGIGSDGSVGMLKRDGQDKDSACCGAACAAYHSTVSINKLGPQDMQQNELTKLMRPLQKAIQESPDPMRWLAYTNFQLSHYYLKKILKNYEGKCKEIAVIGCITLNLPTPIDDYYVPLTFERFDCKTGVREDLFGLFGHDRGDALYFSGKSPVFFDSKQ